MFKEFFRHTKAKRITTGTAILEMLKEVFQAERKYYQMEI
jgi:hypothetical protein